MKKFVWVVLVCFLSSTNAFGRCYKIDCTGYIEQEKQRSKTLIDNSYIKLKAELDELKAKYEKQLQTLEKQNELLEKYLKMVSETTLDEKELLFLMEKFNSLKSNDISIKAIENEK